MKKLLYLFLIAVSFMTLEACGSKKTEGRNPQARQLYLNSLRLCKVYTDSMKHAGDSSEILRLGKAYDESLSKLEYNYPPDLGLEISEGENDTLTKLTLRFISVRDSVMKMLARQHIEHKDSSDSSATD